MTVLICQCGYKKTIEILLRWPSYILMPMFSIFSYGTKKIGDRKFLVCSTRWTLCNLVITLAGRLFDGWYVYYMLSATPPYDTYKIYLFLAFPLMFFAIVLYTIFMTVDLCSCCCTRRFIKKSGVDVDKFEVVFLEDVKPDSNMIEL